MDPLDGTKNFAWGGDVFSISIALTLDKKPVLGVIFHPCQNEIYRAVRGKGAFCNGKRLLLDEGPSLERSFLATGFPHGKEFLVDNYIDGLGKVLKRAMAVRRFGSAAYDLSHVASGMFDGFWEFGLEPWDMAAGVIIASEAGAVVSNVNGKPWNLLSESILVAKQNTHAELVGVVKIG